MRAILRSTQGFTFVESLITFSIVGIFLALTWATATFVLQKNAEQAQRTRAHFLSVEGMEIVKQIRQTKVNEDRVNGFYTAIGNREGDHVIEQNGPAFFLKEGSNEEIEMIESPSTVYCRTVNISGENNDVKEVRVRVQWGNNTDCSLGKELVEYSTFLAKANPS